LSVLADAPIPFQKLLDASIMGASPVFPRLNTTRLAALRDGLETLGLLDIGPAESGAVRSRSLATWRLHPLIRDTSLFHLADSGQAPMMLDLAVKLLLNAMTQQEDFNDPANWAFYRLVAPHPIHLLNRAAATPGLNPEVISGAAEAASLVTRYMATQGLFAVASYRFAKSRTVSQPNPYKAGIGDIIFFDDTNDNLIDHSMIVTGYDKDTKQPTLTYHSNDQIDVTLDFVVRANTKLYQDKTRYFALRT
jgi:hypothetical protein